MKRCRLRGSNIIIRSLCHFTEGAKYDTLVFFQTLAEKGLPKKSYWVNLFLISWVGRCTGDPIIALKTLSVSNYNLMATVWVNSCLFASFFFFFFFVGRQLKPGVSKPAPENLKIL